MKLRNAMILGLTVLLASFAVLTGCDSGGGSSALEVGDAVGGGYTVSKIDPAGGFIAKKSEGGTDYRKITGTFTDDVTMESNYTWMLDGMVFIGDGSSTNTLTIQKGTTIKGQGGTPPGTLVIAQNADIIAEGTESEPIVMTSAKPAGYRGPGDWGGLVINGKAQINSGDTAQGEGNSGTYGGNDDTDDSGMLRYVRVEYAGHVFTSEDELNGIAFQAVGSGTEVDHIQVHQNKDDGVEFFGGTVDVSHVVLTGNNDDSLDWTSGWTGSAQYVVIQHHPGAGDQAIEADNLEGSTDATPRSAPTLANFTMIGDGSTEGVLFRRGTDATLINSIVSNFNTSDGEALDETHDSGDARNVSYQGVVVSPNSSAYGDSTVFSDSDDANNTGNGVEDLGTTGAATDGETADAYGTNWDAISQSAATPQSTGLDSAGDSFIGAIGSSDWTANWTTNAKN